METIRGLAQSAVTTLRQPHILRIVAVCTIVSVLLLQFVVMRTRQLMEDVVKIPPPSADSANKTYLYKNLDPGVHTRPVEQIDFCNRVAKGRHPREMHFERSKAEPLKVFTWRQTSWSTNVDWHKESQTLCPIPLVLQPFFDHFLEVRVNDPSLKWEVGYIPCVFWTLVDGREMVHTKESCDTSTYGQVDYIFSTNYTEFEDADIVYFDYSFYDGLDTPPYIDLANFPPRIAHQKWVLWWLGESIGYYPHVGLPYYLNQFDMSAGSPAAAMDIGVPIYGMNKQKVLDLADIAPSIPINQTTENYAAILVSNCAGKNNRNGLIQALIDKAGGHSYGGCLNNKAIPDGHGRDGDWMTTKRKILGGYPFVFAGENSNCVDYVTEKIYNALEVGAIPIYLGAANIADYVPAGSYVDAHKFENFTMVAEYITTVDRAPFYKWKDIVKKDPSKFCKSCFELQTPVMCHVLEHVRFDEPATP